MASKGREAPDLVALQQALQDAPYDFDFFQAVRRLECIYHDKPRLGQSLKASDDPIRLAQEPSLRFALHRLSHLNRVMKTNHRVCQLISLACLVQTDHCLCI